jgi:hypothetical protein
MGFSRNTVPISEPGTYQLTAGNVSTGAEPAFVPIMTGQTYEKSA